MVPRSIPHLPIICVLALLGVAGVFTSPARADIHSQAQDAHHNLEQALNPGGETPSDADRISFLKSALDALKNFPPIHYPRRLTMVRDDIRRAIDEIKNGDPDHQAANCIREADSIVRDFESAS